MAKVDFSSRGKCVSSGTGVRKHMGEEKGTMDMEGSGLSSARLRSLNLLLK